MEPFAQDNSAFAFQKPFQPQGEGPKGAPLKPFTAVDLAPHPSASKPAMAPAVSPFLESFGNPFENKGAPAKTAPALEPPPRAGFHGAEPAPVEDYMPVLAPVAPAAPAPAPAPVPSFTPVPAPKQDPSVMPPLPAAARQSQILAASDLQGVASSSARPRFFMTTTASVDGFSIQSYLDVLSVEVVLPKDLLFRNPAPYGELHRLKAAEDQLQKVKAKAMEELAEKARQVHADGVVSVQITFVNLDTVCCLCSVVGTAVKIA